MSETITKREQIATKMMAALVARCGNASAGRLASDATNYADALIAHLERTPTSEDSSVVEADRASEPELDTAPCSAWHRTADKHPPPLTAVEITHPNFIGTRIGMLYPLSMRLRLTDCTHPLKNSYVPIEGSAWRLLPNTEGLASTAEGELPKL